MNDEIIHSYSRLADAYESEVNRNSCWGKVADRFVRCVLLEKVREVRGDVADIGCGTGRTLLDLAAGAKASTKFTGVEPAERMRQIASLRVQDRDDIRIIDGRFESLGLPDGSFDYVYSTLAFHWTEDPTRSVGELRRVLKHDGRIDLLFAGRWTGREFIRATTPVYMRHLGPALLFRAVGLRRQFTVPETVELFSRAFPQENVRVTESFETHYDTLESHMGWWIRFEGQLCGLPTDRLETCRTEVSQALSRLGTEWGIPYTTHLIHVEVDLSQ
jgi:ubiquinone/menaquinone biosynthesis C-methylase UbiE